MRRLLALAIALLVWASPASAAFTFKDLTCETSTTTGTGTLSLGGAASNYLSFLTAGVASGDTVPYQISASDGKFETGVGTFTDATPDTLARTTVVNSSDGVGTALTLPAGTHTVCIGPIVDIWTGGKTWTFDNSTSGVVKTGTIELGAASDTTLARSSAGHISVEGSVVGLASNDLSFFTTSTSNAIGVGTIELGHASDTTLARSSAGHISVEGSVVGLASNDLSFFTTSTSNAIGVGTIELGAASDTTLSRSAAGKLAVEGVLTKQVGTETLWIPASALTANTTNGCAPGTVETATNLVMLKTCDYDATTAESAQIAVRMPKSWDLGTVTATFVWKHEATATNFGVAWDAACVSLSDTDAGDTAFGTVQTVTDTGGTTDTIYITSASAAITCAGTPAAGDTTWFRFRRAPANGSDTMAIDAGLLGVQINYTSNAANDS